MYVIKVNPANVSNFDETTVFPTLKSLKDWIKGSLKCGDLKELAAIETVSTGDHEINTECTKWFMVSYYGTHALKKEKLWIEQNYFSK